MKFLLDKTSVTGPPVWLVVATLALAACSGGSNPSAGQSAGEAAQEPQSSEGTPVQTSVPQGKGAAAIVPTEAATLEPSDTQAPTASAPQAAETQTQPAPTPRQDLFASDPGSVELASGQYQFLEFFAFW